MEFTKQLIAKNKNNLTIFEYSLAKAIIRHNLIKPYTPKHNGKVERSQQKDNKQFNVTRHFYSNEDANKELQPYLKKYNNFSMHILN